MTELRKQFKKDHPETIGETDRSFDDSNYIDWLENRVHNLEEKLKEAYTDGFTDSIFDFDEENYY